MQELVAPLPRMNESFTLFAVAPVQPVSEVLLTLGFSGDDPVGLNAGLNVIVAVVPVHDTVPVPGFAQAVPSSARWPTAKGIISTGVKHE